MDLPENGRNVAKLGPPSPAGDGAGAADQVVVGAGQTNGDNIGLELNLLDQLQQGNVVFVAELVKVDVSDDSGDASIVMIVGLTSVEDIVLANPDQQVAGTDVLDAVGGGQDPLVGEQGCAALVPELAVFVLSQRHLPRPLTVAGNASTHDASLSHEPAATNVFVMRPRVQGVKVVLSLRPPGVVQVVVG